MILYKNGDLTEVERGYIIHGCNDCGAMGSGVAKAVRNKFPEAYNEYRDWFAKHCSTYNEEYLPLGEYQFVCADNRDLIVVNAITQHEYLGFRGIRENRRYVSYWAIFKALSGIQHNNTFEWDLHIPRIGAGLGGGDWKEIVKHIERSHEPYKHKFNIVVWDYD